MATLRSLRDEVLELTRNMDRLKNHVVTEIERKEMFRRAGKPMLNEIVNTTPIDTGTLKNSIEYLPFTRSRKNVFIGPNYRKGGSHAHLIEKGWITRSGSRVEGKYFIRKGMRKTQKQVLTNLEMELKQSLAKFKV
jgi:hypothetical protein